MVLFFLHCRSLAPSSKCRLTESQAAAFFLSPQEPLHRRYEALRAYFVERLPSAEAARRFGYSPARSASCVISSVITPRNALPSSAPYPARTRRPPVIRSANG